MNARAPRTATLLERRDLTPDLAVFRLVLEGGVPDFEAGQFLPLGLELRPGEAVWRAYSIASPPETKDWVELYIRWVRSPTKGRFTTALWDRTAGDTVLWRPPRGRFTIADRKPDGSPDERRLLLVAAGTGLAPFVSYALHLRHVGTNREVVVCHGASHVAELGYRGLLGELASEERDTGGRLLYLPTVSRPAEPANAGWEGHTGRVEHLLARTGGRPSPVERAIGAAIGPDDTCIHVCGYEGTIHSVVGVVEPLGFRTLRERRADGSYDVHVESYG